MKSYAELHCNDAELRIKSRRITHLVKLGYAVETTANTKPAAFTWLERVNSISGIELPSEQIDASALEDLVTKYVAGRQDSGKKLAA